MQECHVRVAEPVRVPLAGVVACHAAAALLLHDDSANDDDKNNHDNNNGDPVPEAGRLVAPADARVSQLTREKMSTMTAHGLMGKRK
jgi:hypothetical protein